MRRIVIALMMIMSFFGALYLMVNGECYAQSPLMWQEDGIPIRQGSEVEWSGSTAQMGDDKVLAVWTDTRTGFRAVMAQLYDKNGKIWEEDLFVGEQVYWSEEESDSRNSQEDASNRSQQSDGEPVAVASSDGNVIVAWSKIKGHYGHKQASMVVNKISENGELLWGDGFTLPDGKPYSFKITADNEGGAYVIWDRYNEWCVYGLHLNASGEPFSDGWNRETGLQLTRESFSSFSLCSDGENGALFIFSEKWSSNDRLTIIRVSPYGEVFWKREIRETNGKSLRTAIVANTGDNFFGVFYETTEKSQPKNYLLVVDINGEYVWEKPILVKEGNSVIERSIQNIGTSDNCFIVSWVEYYYHYEPYPIEKFELYTQKIDLNGNRLWGETGIKVAETESQLSYGGYRLVNDNEGDGAILSWVKKEPLSSHRDVFIQRVNASGELVWGKDGIQVTDISGWRNHGSINFIENNLFVTWSDKRDGSNSIFCQVYDKNMQPLFADNGELIYQGLSGSASSSSTIQIGDYIYIVWTDYRFGEYHGQIMAQKIDADGNYLYEMNGIPVTSYTGANQMCGTRQSVISIIHHHSDGIAIAWTEKRGSLELVYVQAIGPDGEKLWDPNGDGKGIRVTVEANVYTQDNPVISRKGEEYFIAWDETDPGEDYSCIRDIKAQKIVDGEKMWGDEGIKIAWQHNDYQVDHYVAQFLNGEYILWTKGGELGQTIKDRFYLKRINSDGTVAEGWDEYGVMVSDYSGFRPTALLTSDGVVVIWDALAKQDNDDLSNKICAQLISPNGNIQWGENGIFTCNYPKNYRSRWANAFYDGEHIYFAWELTEDNNPSVDIAVQKLDLDGNLLWSDQAVIITQNDFENLNPTIVKSGDSALITWTRRFFNKDWREIRMQLISAQTGQPTWDKDGILISPFGYSRCKTAVLDNSEAVVVWEDERSSDDEFWHYYNITNIYAQKVNIFSELSVEEDIASPQEAMKLYANYPNPFNPDTKISFNLSQNENISLKVFNIKGQLVKTLLDEEYLENGKHSVVWDGRDEGSKAASSGIYFYRLEGEKESYTRKMALIK